MIQLSIRRVHPEQVDALRAWCAQLQGPRRAEAIATLAAEGIDHELAQLVNIGGEHVLVYAMESDDLARGREVAAASERPIDAEHRAVLHAADAGPVPGERVLDLRPEP